MHSESAPATLFEQLSGRLVVSVQADPGSPMRGAAHLIAMTSAVLAGGAAGLRLEGLGNVVGAREITAVPIIGLVKSPLPDWPVYITPTIADALALRRAGAEIVAVDATLRPRPEPFQAIVEAIHATGGLVLADISTHAEAEAAMEAGADLAATTLAGYTEAAAPMEGPDFALMASLGRAGIPFAAEGRLRTAEEARRCLSLGATFVIVGSAITRPDAITRWFAAALTGARSRERTR